ncbi:MAG: site-2 protease family protein [Phycisphaerales bacterium JB041]
MKGSLRIARLFGIDVAIHWTFLLLVVYVVFLATRQQSGLAGTVVALAFIGGVFTCVVLHEFGHALTARAFGIKTRHITILPIGGVAALERMPTKPGQELLVAVAGPAVNVVIAAVLLAGVLLAGDLRTPPNPFTQDAGFFGMLALVNIALVLFNMLPAFPMDGGRVLRALLAFRLDYARATRVAAMVGRVMAVGLLVWGVMAGNPVLMIIAVFVYMGGGAEAAAATQRAAMQGTLVGDVMQTAFHTIAPEASLGEAADAVIASSQRDFPVVDADTGRFLGVLRHDDLAGALTTLDTATPVASVMRTNLPALPPDTPMLDAIELLRTHPPVLPVTSAGDLVGMLSVANVNEFLLLHATPGHARRIRRSRED